MVIETGQRMIFEDIQNDDHYRTLSREGKVVALGFESAAAFPIMAKEKSLARCTLPVEPSAILPLTKPN